MDLRIGNEPHKYVLARSEVRLNSYLVPCTLWGKCYVSLHRSPLRSLAKRASTSLSVAMRHIIKPL